MRDGSVDDVLDHLGYRRGCRQASELGYAEDRHQADVGTHVRQVSPQRQQAQVEKDSFRPFFGQTKPREGGSRSVYRLIKASSPLAGEVAATAAARSSARPLTIAWLPAG